MKKLLAMTATAGLMVATAGAAASLDVDIGTAHVFRGATVIDDLVVQPSIALSGFGMDEKYGEITVGAWGSVAPFSDAFARDNFYETDWYLSYALPQFTEDLDLWVAYTAYQYVADQEKELNFGGSYLLGDFNLGTTLNFMIDSLTGLTQDQIYWDLYADYTFDINEKFDVNAYALLGIMLSQGDLNDVVLDAGFNHYELGANAVYDLSEIWNLGVDLAYIGQGDSDVLPNAAYDKGVVLFFSASCEM